MEDLTTKELEILAGKLYALSAGHKDLAEYAQSIDCQTAAGIHNKTSETLAKNAHSFMLEALVKIGTKPRNIKPTAKADTNPPPQNE